MFSEAAMMVVAERDRLSQLSEQMLRFEARMNVERTSRRGRFPIDALNVEDRSISATCFGHTVKAVGRIAMHGNLMGEYVFSDRDEFHEHRVCAIYVRFDGVVGTDPGFASTLGDVFSAEEELNVHVAQSIAQAMLSSSLLSPRDLGAIPLSR